MAKPQIENGYTPIANEIAEALCQVKLSPNEWRILWAIWRKTYGWHKKNDHISLTQLSKLTKINKYNVSRTLKRLKERNIITRSNGTIGFQKDYEQWQLSEKLSQVIRADNKKLSRLITTKENKENNISRYINNKFSFKGPALSLPKGYQNRQSKYQKIVCTTEEDIQETLKLRKKRE
jgi:phage replication O-like protein O